MFGKRRKLLPAWERYFEAGRSRRRSRYRETYYPFDRRLFRFCPTRASRSPGDSPDWLGGTTRRCNRCSRAVLLTFPNFRVGTGRARPSGLPSIPSARDSFVRFPFVPFSKYSAGLKSFNKRTDWNSRFAAEARGFSAEMFPGVAQKFTIAAPPAVKKTLETDFLRAQQQQQPTFTDGEAACLLEFEKSKRDRGVINFLPVSRACRRAKQK